jgi:antitoxin PrlF
MKNIAILETESTLTDRYQTTVPKSVRQALKLGKHDKLHYSILDNGDILLSRGQKTETDDPALDQFLSFLSNDIATHPERIQALDGTWVNRLQTLVGTVKLDLDASRPDDEV